MSWENTIDGGRFVPGNEKLDYERGTELGVFQQRRYTSTSAEKKKEWRQKGDGDVV